MNEAMIFNKELRNFLKAEKRISKFKLTDTDQTKNNVNNFIRELVSKYNSLTKSTGDSNSNNNNEPVKEEPQAKRRKIEEVQTGKISHSLFNLYEDIQNKPIQKLLKESKKKNEKDNKKKRQRKSQ
jgi:hypothetical protein